MSHTFSININDFMNNATNIITTAFNVSEILDKGSKHKINSFFL